MKPMTVLMTIFNMINISIAVALFTTSPGWATFIILSSGYFLGDTAYKAFKKNKETS